MELAGNWSCVNPVRVMFCLEGDIIEASVENTKEEKEENSRKINNKAMVSNISANGL